MEICIRKIGNSKGAVIPAPLLKELGLDVGQIAQADIQDGRLIIQKLVKKKYTLSELLAKCDEHAEMPKELLEWDQLDTVGDEI